MLACWACCETEKEFPMSNADTAFTHIGALTPTPGNGGNSSKVAAAQLRSVVERIEALEADKREIADAIRDVYSEAEGNGYDVKALRTIVRLRRSTARTGA
jgi:uncharacterized protein (UPF0335 family)